MPYTLTTQAQVDYLIREFPHFNNSRYRYVGYTYVRLPSEPYYTRLRELENPRVWSGPRYQNHHEPEILPLP